MKIFLTGSTGFVGKRVLQDLLENNYQVRCLVRQGSEQKIAHDQAKGVAIVYGDITNFQSMEGKLTGCDAVINLVGIIRAFPGRGITFEKMHYEGTAHLANAAKSQGVRRFIQMSSLGARPGGKTPYLQTKYRAEECVRNSGLEYTIFRPSIIFGPGDSFVNLFANMFRRQQFVPVVGNGKYQLQPVSVENVSKGFINSLERSDTIGKSFDVGGPERLEFDAIIDAIGETLGLPPHKMHIPVFVMQIMAEMLDWLPFFPVTNDQITMLLDGNVCDEKPFFDHFNITPDYFKPGIHKYLSV